MLIFRLLNFRHAHLPVRTGDAFRKAEVVADVLVSDFLQSSVPGFLYRDLVGVAQRILGFAVRVAEQEGSVVGDDHLPHQPGARKVSGNFRLLQLLGLHLFSPAEHRADFYDRAFSRPEASEGAFFVSIQILHNHLHPDFRMRPLLILGSIKKFDGVGADRVVIPGFPRADCVKGFPRMSVDTDDDSINSRIMDVPDFFLRHDTAVRVQPRIGQAASLGVTNQFKEILPQEGFAHKGKPKLGVGLFDRDFVDNLFEEPHIYESAAPMQCRRGASRAIKIADGSAFYHDLRGEISLNQRLFGSLKPGGESFHGYLLIISASERLQFKLENCKHKLYAVASYLKGMRVKVPYHRHGLGDQEIASFKETLESGFITGGPRVGEFEKKFSEFLGVDRVVAVNSCTNALHLALCAYGVGGNSEKPWRVITTPLSFVATANAAIYRGLEPTFVDVDPKTGLMDLDKLEQVVQKFININIAILPVHLYGQMVDMERLRSICSSLSKGLIIEDAAHCIDGSRNGYVPGSSLSDAACFSFHALKTMTSGDGGAIALNNKEKADQLSRLRSHGLSRSAVERQHDYSVPDMTELGYKYNLSDIQAALLIPQIRSAHAKRLERAEIAAQYREAFGNEPRIGLLSEEPDVVNSFSQFIILVDPNKRLEIINHIRAAGVEVIASYSPIHLMTYYRKRFQYVPYTYPHAERIGFSSIALPIYCDLTDLQRQRVVEVVLNVVRSA